MDSPPAPLPPPLPVTASGRNPRGYRIGSVLAVAAIVASITVVMQFDHGSRTFASPGEVAPNPMINMLARYGFGTQQFLAAMPAEKAEIARAVENSLTPLAREPADKFRAEIVRSFMHGRLPNVVVLQDLQASTPWIGKDIAALKEVQTLGRSVAPETWDWFLARHGWVARLARAQVLPADDPEWRALRSDGLRTAASLAGTVLFGLAAIGVGIALLVRLARRWRRDPPRAAVERLPAPWGGVFVEAFALYMAGWIFVPLSLRHFAPDTSRWVAISLATLSVPVAMLWPRLRGMDRATWRRSLGLHLGKGFWREVGAGLVGWIMTSPFIALGAVAATLITKLTGKEAGHPIIDPLSAGGGSQIAAALLAVVWAPLAEETMFRGLLFPGLAAWLRWIAGALVGAFVFAVIHPQGWAGVPAIMIIALGASALRCTRGTLVAPMAMHALNNGILTTMLILSTS